jgi:hypothetical protein
MEPATQSAYFSAGSDPPPWTEAVVQAFAKSRPAIQAVREHFRVGWAAPQARHLQGLPISGRHWLLDPLLAELREHLERSGFSIEGGPPEREPEPWSPEQDPTIIGGVPPGEIVEISREIVWEHPPEWLGWRPRIARIGAYDDELEVDAVAADAALIVEWDPNARDLHAYRTKPLWALAVATRHLVLGSAHYERSHAEYERLWNDGGFLSDVAGKLQVRGVVLIET